MASLIDTLRADLVTARRAGDAVRSSALRLGLAAVANAEAVDPAGPTRAAGLAGDVARRPLTDADVVAVLGAERDDLRAQAAALRARGRPEADDLDARATALSVYLVTDGSGPPRPAH